MNPRSAWWHISLSVVMFIIGGVVVGVGYYFLGQGSHYHKTTLVFAIFVGAVVGLVTYFRSRSNRAARDLGHQLRAKIDADRGQGGQPVQQPETQSVSETGPRHPV